MWLICLWSTHLYKIYSLNAICCFFLKAQREIKTDFGVSKSELENQISFVSLFCRWNFQIISWTTSDICPFRPQHFVLSTDQTSIGHMLFQWVIDVTQLFLINTKMLENRQFWFSGNFWIWGAKSVFLNWSLWDKNEAWPQFVFYLF